jgi:hypothetical protein
MLYGHVLALGALKSAEVRLHLEELKSKSTEYFER